MSTDIAKLIEKLENTRISECSDAFERRTERLNTEQCFCRLLMAADDEVTEKSRTLAVFNELWGWYCGGTEDGVWQYFEHNVNKELINETADVLRKYGCEEFAEQYINAGKELMPLMAGKPPYTESERISTLSERYDRYIDEHADEICIVMKNHILDNRNEVCSILSDAVISLPADDMYAPFGGFCSVDAPQLSDEKKAELSAVIESFSGIMDNPALSAEQREELAAAIKMAMGGKTE